MTSQDSMDTDGASSAESGSPTLPTARDSVGQAIWKAIKAVIANTALIPRFLGNREFKFFDGMEIEDPKLSNKGGKAIEQKPLMKPKKRIYDIQTLLKLREKAIKPVQPLKFATHVINRK